MITLCLAFISVHAWGKAVSHQSRIDGHGHGHEWGLASYAPIHAASWQPWNHHGHEHITTWGHGLWGYGHHGLAGHGGYGHHGLAGHGGYGLDHHGFAGHGGYGLGHHSNLWQSHHAPHSYGHLSYPLGYHHGAWGLNNGHYGHHDVCNVVK